MTNFLTSWRTFWHHDELFDIMTCLWHYDEFLMWFDVMTYVALIDVITIILTPGTFWQHDAFCWHPDTLFDLMTNLFTRFLSFWLYFSSLFRVQNIIKTGFWCHSELFDIMACRIFDFMTNFLTSWRILTLFRTWRILLTSWHTFWPHD